MDHTDFVPAEPGEEHFQITERAASWLAAAASGNGLEAGQVRLDRHDTSVYQLPGAMTVTLEPRVRARNVTGRNPQGTVLPSKEAVMERIGADVPRLLARPETQHAVLEALDASPGGGFGAQDTRVPLAQAGEEYCVIRNCDKCHGQTFTRCGACFGTGESMCRDCMGSGVENKPGGAQGPCSACDGKTRVWCKTCKGDGRIACDRCAASGQFTQVYSAACDAALHFELDSEKIPPEIEDMARKAGLAALAGGGHIEVFRGPPALLDNGGLRVPFCAFYPVAEAEFQIAGKTHAARIAGLKGRFVRIDPFLDAFVKPGISALVRISKGPMAGSALMHTACRFKALRRALKNVAAHSRAEAYRDLRAEYPLVLSDKYLRAIVQYADLALLSVGRGPRNFGLGVGTAAATLLFAAWFPWGLRAALAPRMGAMAPAADLLLLALGWTGAFFTIRFMARRALRGNMPPELLLEQEGLPHAGEQGGYAAVTVFIPWLLMALHTQAPWLRALLEKTGAW